MDPQQRLLLERGYGALHAAGLERASLKGSLTGVFIGMSFHDYEIVSSRANGFRSVYSATGSSASVACARLSYILGMQGPAVSYDTACSAALTASHAATSALRLGECESGLVAGVSLMLLPDVSHSFAVAGMLSALGRSHTFDRRADGYARGEACCAWLLQGGATARRPVASALGSCVRQDGKSASLTAPNGLAQQSLLEAALADAAVVADSLACSEAHGTGTSLGDPIEARSLAAAVLARRGGGEALAVGSIKANCGHGEPAAGAGGLLRLLLGLCGAEAPPNAQLRVLNPHVSAALEGKACVLPTQLAALRSTAAAAGSQEGGVSSFGYSGTIVHAVLRAAPGEAGRGALARRVECGPQYRRRRFGWRETPHPLAEARLDAAGDCAAVRFRSASDGGLRSLVADHVVLGRVLFPAAGFLEMARAACAASWATELGADTPVGLRRAFFMQPLPLGESGGLWVEVSVDAAAAA